MKKKDLRGFAKQMQVTAKGVERNADALVRTVALAVAATVVLRTPVDTGRARANWQASVGSPPAGTLPEPSSPGAGAQQAIDSATAAAGAYKGGKGAAIWLTNNLPYIGRLNEGSSTQAPANFVQAAILTAVRKIKGARLVR